MRMTVVEGSVIGLPDRCPPIGGHDCPPSGGMGIPPHGQLIGGCVATRKPENFVSKDGTRLRQSHTH